MGHYVWMDTLPGDLNLPRFKNKSYVLIIITSISLHGIVEA